MAFEKENRVRLYVENGACLEICPNPDAPEIGVAIFTPNDISEQWFGKINLILRIDECKALGEALVEFADNFKR